MFGLGLMEGMMIEEAIIDSSMMGGMGMGYGMGGMGYGMGMGMCPIGCTGPCCTKVIVRCPPGCMNSCCRNVNVIRCPPGCMNACCQVVYRCPPNCNQICCMGRNQIQVQTSQQQYVRSLPTNQYQQTQQQQVIQKPIYQPQTQQTYEPQKYQTQQNYQQKQPTYQQPNYQQKTYQQPQMKQQVKNIQQPEIYDGQPVYGKIVDNQNQSIDSASISVPINNKNNYPQLNQYNQTNQNNQIKQQIQPNNQQQKYQSQILHQGEVYVLTNGSWVKSLQTLTCSNFMNIPVRSITKLKAKSDMGHYNTYIIKISHHLRDDFISVQSKDHCDLAVRIIWARMAFMNKYSDLYAQPQVFQTGQLFKQSFFGEWQRRHITIDTKSGILTSSKSRNQTPNLIINSTPQIWTRFHLINGDSFLVIKMKDGISKVEFAIPVDYAVLWLRAFYTLLKVVM